MNDDARATPGLRERRRIDTCRELSDAAIELFERHGVHGTTVDHIAEAAGVSPRTFFRYAATKENAVFLDDDTFDWVIERTLDALVAGSPLASAIEIGLIEQVTAFDASPPADQQRALRLRRLVLNEPSLLAVALARDEQQRDELLRRILDTLGADAVEFDTRAIVISVGAIARLAFDEWARLAEAGRPARVRELYDYLRATLVTHFTDTPHSPIAQG